MRIVIIFVTIVFLVCLMVFPALAQAPVSYESTVTISNVSGTAGNITVTYYNNNGTTAGTNTDNIAAYESKIYTTLPGLSGSFDGAMIISADVPIVSDSMLIAKDDVDAIHSYASYVGVSSGAQTLYFPLLMDSNYKFSTFYSIQNTSSASVDVDITYSDGLTATISSLSPGASVTIDNRDEPHVLPGGNAGAVFSAKVEATDDIAAVVVEYSEKADIKPLYAFNGFSSGSTTPIFAIVNENNFNYWSSLQVQNIGTVSTTVTIQYTPTLAGIACEETKTIEPEEMEIFATKAFYNEPQTPSHTCDHGAQFVGVGIVSGNSANQPLVGIINQLNSKTGVNRGGALMTLNPLDATSTVAYPEVYRWYGSDQWWSGITLFNVSGFELPIDDITCRAVGTDTSGAVDVTWTNSTAISDRSGWTINFSKNVGPTPLGFAGSVVCTSATGSLVGMQNSLGAAPTKDTDTLVVLEGINVSP
jgi:hypothetical protein